MDHTLTGSHDLSDDDDATNNSNGTTVTVNEPSQGTLAHVEDTVPFTEAKAGTSSYC